MSQKDYRHVALVAELIEKREDVPPVIDGDCITMPETTVCLFDRPDTIGPTNIVENQAFQPIETVDHNGLIRVFFFEESLKRTGNFCQAFCQRELCAVDFSQAVLCLNENRIRRVCTERAFTHALLTIDHESGRPIVAAGGNVCQNRHVSFPYG